jgi:threonine/homoserine/homoserine lactone efflux protein
MGSNELVALAAFIAVGSGSPGPNNTLLMASGMNFGFRRTVPHVIGSAIGIGLLVAVSAAGVGAAVTAAPAVELALKIGASVYLLVLAFKLVRGFSMDRASLPDPFTVGRATAFQFINPKGWFFALALVGVLVGSDGTSVTSALVVIAFVLVIVGVTATAWAAAGSMLDRALQDERARRVTGIALGVLLAGSVILIWE